MGRVFILGAGASRFARYPLAPQLWEFVKALSGGHVMAQQRRDEVVAKLESVFPAFSSTAPKAVNLEEVFTYLDLAALGSSPIALPDVDWRWLRPKVMGMIAEAFQRHEYCLQRETVYQSHHFGTGIQQEVCIRTLRAWMDYLGDGDTIITFNWDLLHEAALWRESKWHYANGYGFLPAGEDPVEKESAVRVLKLHGSVNWAQRDEQDAQPAVEHKMDFFKGGLDKSGTYQHSRGQWNEGRYLIIPTYLKDLSSNRLLLDIWNQAASTLETAEQVTVIGFQLNPADAPARQLIASAIVKNKQIRTITVVSPDGGVYWEEFCTRIGMRRKPIFATFEDWVIRASP